jgi:pimeloyl-ACP methyl ester carboxylesterase
MSFKRSLTKLLPKGNDKVALIAAHMKEVIDYQMTRDAFFNGYRRVVDFDERYAATVSKLADWPGEILLMMATDDPATPEITRETMKALYPRAQERLFQGTGHVTAILNHEEYCSIIAAFVG